MHYENLKHPFIRPNKIILGENIEKISSLNIKLLNVRKLTILHIVENKSCVIVQYALIFGRV